MGSKETFVWLDSRDVGLAVEKLEMLVSSTGHVEAQICAFQDQNSKLKAEVLRKTEGTNMLKRSCEAALAKQHERLRALRQIIALRQCRRRAVETREETMHVLRNEIISLQSRYNFMMEESASKQAFLQAAWETYTKEHESLLNALESLKKEKEEKFTHTTYVQEAVMLAQEEKNKLVRELEAEDHACSTGKQALGDIDRSRDRHSTYASLRKQVSLLEQKKQKLIASNQSEITRSIQVRSSGARSTKNYHGPYAPYCGRILSELIETAGRTKSPQNVSHHSDI